MDVERDSLLDMLNMEDMEQVCSYRRIERYLAKDDAEFSQMKAILSSKLINKKIHYIHDDNDKFAAMFCEGSEFITRPHLVAITPEESWEGEVLKDDDVRFLTQKEIKAMSRRKSTSFVEPYLWFSIYFQLKLGDLKLFMSRLDDLIKQNNYLKTAQDWFGLLDTMEEIFEKGDFYGWHFQEADGLWHRQSPKSFRRLIMPHVDKKLTHYMNQIFYLREPWNFICNCFFVTCLFGYFYFFKFNITKFGHFFFLILICGHFH